METALTILVVLSVTAILALIIDPKAKLLLAEAIAGLSRLACQQLRARAHAQRAARETWERTYQRYRHLVAHMEVER
jgi:hypothetical protein